MTRKFVMPTLAFLSIVPSALMFTIGVSPATSAYETVAQNTGGAGEAAEWAKTWCTSPRQGIDHRCSSIGTR
jgi:hypothetical protein